MEREQIIKALELHSQGAVACLHECPYGDLRNCGSAMARDALSLIKELTEENERLRANNKQLVNDNAELKNQIQEEIAEEDINLFDEFSKLLHEGIREAKADTVRKMQERLDKRFCHDPAFLGVEQRLIMDVIDQIAKEMLEEGK